MNRHDNLLDRQRQLLGLNGLLGVGASFMLGRMIGGAEVHARGVAGEDAQAGRGGAHATAAKSTLRLVA
ncbi:MAG: hypothetical protein PHY45_02305 [Rhodocyclaceae bacterium]|nr:hypothetical protein [Rhodocyclaceae bacterium]